MVVIRLFIFAAGLIIGSFLNCLIYRLEISEQGWLKKMIFGRSFCPNCRHTLAWYDLIPVLSFVFLKGRCRYCKKRISIQYPLVELVTGILFVFVFWHWSLGIGVGHWDLLNFVYLLFIVACLIVIFIFDLKHYLIPDEIVYPAIVIILLYRVLGVLGFGNLSFIRNWSLEIRNFGTLLNPLISAIIAGAFFFYLYW